MSRPASLLCALVWALALGCVLPATAYAEAGVFAIVVGNNAPPQGDSSLGVLRYADDDAVRYLQLLGRRADRSWLFSVLDQDTQRRHSRLAANAEVPSLQAVLRAVAEVREAVLVRNAKGERSEVYFVFSGHGAHTADGTPYLALSDGPLTQTILYDQILATLPASVVHLVIDACNAGAMVGARGPFDRALDATTAPVTKAEAKAVVGATSLSRFPNVGAIVATTDGKEAHEWSRLEAGVFTHELLSAAVGAGDLNGDRAIEYSEIVAFIASANSQLTDSRARPDIIAIEPAVYRRAPWIRLDRLENVVTVKGDAGRFGHFFIELDDGLRYLDAHLAPGEPLAVVLPSKRRAFLRTPTWEVALPDQDGGTVTIDPGDARRRETSARGGVEATYRKDLFASAYGRTYYRGYVDSSGLMGVPVSEAQLALDEGGVPASSWIAFGVAGVATVAAVVGALGAASAKADFDATNIRAEADAASARYDRNRVIAWTGAGVAAAATGVGVWLWLDSGPDLPSAGSVDAGGSGMSAGLVFSGRF